MKNYLYFLLIIFGAFAANFHAQSAVDYETILRNYQYNKYNVTAVQTETYIEAHKNLSVDTLITLLEINAVSNFALGKKEKSRTSFFKILKLNENYRPDPKLISPKIIRFFEGVKKDYFEIKETFLRRRKEIEDNRKVEIKRKDLVERQKQTAIGASLSVLFPGAGHLYFEGATPKSVAFVAGSAILLGGTIYSFIHTESLRKEYLNEVDPELLEEKYADYNDAYKTRNYFIASYAVLWTLAQLDLFWFSSEKIFGKINISLKQNSNNDFSITLSGRL